MKSYISLFIILTGFFLNSGKSFGQDPKDGMLQDLGTTDLEEELPPLDELITIALNNSPYIKISDANIDIEEDEVIVEKRSWQETISLFGNYSVGNQNFLVASGQQQGIAGFLNGYRVGVNAYIPLSLFTTRPARVRIAKLEAEAAEFHKEEAELELSNRVTQEYYELLAAYRVLKIKTDARESASMQREMAKEGFADGTVTLEEYSNVDQSASAAAADYENAKSALLIKYNQFEKLLGVSLENLRGR